MADRRASDLSYGHLGEASYDTDEGQWGFAVDTSHNQILEQITSFKESLPSVASKIPEAARLRPKLVQSQMKRIVKTRPETFPANVIVSAFTNCSSATQTGYPTTYGQLIAVGGAVDADHQTEHRTHPIIAIPWGEAGHVLRFIRPQTEYRGWGTHSALKLSLWNAASGDIGYWVGTGGTIRQITFANDGNALGTLLAARQDSTITIFRPMYHKQLVRAVMPSGYDKQYPPSRLSANPVAVLKTETSGSRRHADVSFNPFYTRQLGVVDDLGRWSIWDIEGRMRKGATLELVLGKSGEIYDDFVPNSREKNLGTRDGWHRILWAANVSTIIVCNRCHIAVFDVKSSPTRLSSPGSLSIGANNWILDIKHSPVDSGHIFILTTSRVFWIEVIAAGGEKEAHEAGIRVILSYRHFRDVSDETLSLTVLEEDDVTVLVSSAKSPLVNFYKFSMTSEHTGTPTSSQGSFSFSTSLDNQGLGHEMLQSIRFVSSPLTSSPSRMPGPELHLIERNVKFYQVWALTSAFALKGTLCALYTIAAGASPSKLHIEAPAMRVSFRRRFPESGESMADSFIVADDLASEEEVDYAPGNTPEIYSLHQDFDTEQGHLKSRLDWRGNFQRLYMDSFPRDALVPNLAKSFESMSELVYHVSHRIEQRVETDTLPMTSLLELSHFADFSGDLQASAPLLSNFLQTLRANQDAQESFDLILSGLSSCPGVGLNIDEGSTFSDLLGVYDQVGDHWMASLPLQVSNLARLSKFKVARKLAVELYLSSISVSICKRPSKARRMPLGSDGVDLPPYDEEPNEQQSLMSPQTATTPLPEAGLSLPTPSRTPSVYSQISNDTSEFTEDASVTRLRQYAVSIESQPDLGESELLAQWPSTPGVDPAHYSWRSMADEGEGELDSRRRHEEARRRRRTEKFLNRERMKASQVSSQPMVLLSGSQPELGQPAASSQPVGDIPMTQPDRGAFGARSAIPGKKKKGKRRAAGF